MPTYSDADKTISQLLAALPGPINEARSFGSDMIMPMPAQAVRNLVQKLHIECRGKAGTRVVSGGQSSDGGTQTIAVYQIDLTEMLVVVGNVADTISALDDQDLLADITSYDLAGDPAVALSADGKTYCVALCAILVNGAVEIRAVFGAEADDTSEVEPTAAQCKTALAAAAITNHDDSVGVIFGRIKIQRTAVDTMVFTHTNATTDDSLAQERAVGTLWKLET